MFYKFIDDLLKTHSIGSNTFSNRPYKEPKQTSNTNLCVL